MAKARCSILPDRGWERLQWIQRLMRKRADMVPLPMTIHEIGDVARATGSATFDPGEGSEAIVREAVRGPKKVMAA
jgi:hypothetical protein